LGKDHYTAAREGTDEIGLAVAATTFSIIAVFVPIAFMPGVGGQWFKPFALTMACSVLVSLFVSFSLDPMLSAYWSDPHLEHHEKAWITRQLDKFNHWFNRQAQNYKRVIAWALDHRAAIALIAVGTFIGAFALPTKGLPGLAVVLGGVAAAVVLLERSRHWYTRLISLIIGIAIPVGLLPLVPQFMNVGFGFFPEDDQAELNVSIE
jgi:HAE1 family hydrophobic/amphiphilic exporter-1